ncbi:MAG: hypothetical protein CL607_28815 [Anaerolineaceae bacterium]|jgi:hypothetical protein|nr:hypothetical protein [Anaerolineaceae bacterium]|tara:strand:- start:19 stop:342 length:324 start_codon:yes stop_codon:yes gene_type:complete
MLSQITLEVHQHPIDQEAHSFQPGDVVYYLEVITHPATGATFHDMKQGTIKAVDVDSPYHSDTSRYHVVSGFGLSFLDYVEADKLELITPAQAIDSSGLDRLNLGVL